MATSLSQDLVRGHQADRRADAERRHLARQVPARPRRRAIRVPARARTGLAGALHALARRLEASDSAAVP